MASSRGQAGGCSLVRDGNCSFAPGARDSPAFDKTEREPDAPMSTKCVCRPRNDNRVSIDYVPIVQSHGERSRYYRDYHVSTLVPSRNFK